MPTTARSDQGFLGQADRAFVLWPTTPVSVGVMGGDPPEHLISPSKTSDPFRALGFLPGRMAFICGHQINNLVDKFSFGT